jgi:Tfp pilus assembly protein PilF
MSAKLIILLLLSLVVSFDASVAARESEATLLKKARKLVNEKKNSEAQVVFEKIIATNPKNAEAYGGLAWTQFTQGHREQAEENAKKSIQMNSKNVMAHNVMGAIYFSKGQVEEAKNEFRTVLKIDPHRRCGGCGDMRGLLGSDVPVKQNTKVGKSSQF